MKGVFWKADVDRDGSLSLDDLTLALSDSKVKTMLAAMDLEVNDAKVLFEFIKAQDSDIISLQELTDGVQRLKGTARSIDVVALMRKTFNLELLMLDMYEKLEHLIDLGNEQERLSRSPSITMKHMSTM